MPMPDTKNRISVNIDLQVSEGEKPLTLEQAVDADIHEFARYFCQELNNDSLTRSERSIIKTYLWWKAHQENISG